MKRAAIILVALVINVALYVAMEAMVRPDRERRLTAWETQTIDFVRVPLEDQTRTKDRRRKPPPKPEEVQKPQTQMSDMLLTDYYKQYSVDYKDNMVKNILRQVLVEL